MTLLFRPSHHGSRCPLPKNHHKQMFLVKYTFRMSDKKEMTGYSPASGQEKQLVCEPVVYGSQGKTAVDIFLPLSFSSTTSHIYRCSASRLREIPI